VLDGTGELVLSDAAEGGFLSRGTGLHFEMHPLLRGFLLAKLHELDEERCDDLVTRALRSLGRAHCWDDCLAVLAEFPGTTLAASLLEEALDELLSSGRLATIKRWLSLAPQRSEDSAVLLLAEAEVAVREGLDAQAQALAEQAADLSVASELAARAHLVAARAAHMRCDDPGTQRNADLAASLTRNSHIRTEAQWVAFSHALEAEDGRARQLLVELRNQTDGGPDHSVRIRHASGFIALMVDGDVRQTLSELAPAMSLLRHVSDPLVRTAYLNLFSTTLVYLGEYERSLELSDLQIEVARSSGLDFAADHALLTRASALIGLRRMGLAQRLLRDLESRNEPPSGFIVNGTRLQSARLRATVGDLHGAEILLRDPLPEDLPHASRGENLAVRGLYLAAMGRASAARAAIREARAASTYIDTQGLCELALVISNLREEPAAKIGPDVHSTLLQIIKLGQVDPLVFACRVYTPLAACTTSSESLANAMTKIFTNSRDIALGRAAGLEMPRELRRAEGLSRRERVVYELLSQGLSNREIAKALFISESTTKVHVRHIYEKLGVHSRAQAAAANPPRDD
jgi:DNA-binding CsgD family transcriptional regulator